MAQLVKNPPAIRETWVRSLGWEDPLEKGKDTHSSILTWRIPWTVYSMWSQRVGHDFHFHDKRGFPVGSDSKESICNAGSQEDPLKEGMATHSSIFVWRIPWTEYLVGYSPWGRNKLDITETLTHT